MRVTHLRQRVTISRTGLDSGETELHFGIVAGVIVLISIKATVPLTRPSMLAVNVAKSSMWTIAALVSLNVLVRGSKHPA